ncbi:ATP-dependent helicase [Renibacterium salmoninarum ATCC 33209]|uniref:RNA helicase n=1 Tax=Renibacterium salmoninarum (strain ATCC 33209 / DSM 20767 / JCM 11484 / NBRC 15589 / NCIMB 2235) TaxID=288705 RepID=A9WQ04_RENSM|nr:ATP-dependent RNA helicase HrpA [Renibacterium salmoninarum]ABY23150.1 ATP-dependent helicase [Renibacterium salmoninarum ATCC 33209]
MSLTITYPPELPVSARREELMAAIRDHQVVIIAGETGSGKTTQIPKMCLELGLTEPGKDGKPRLIGHTQPRRLAARTVAERIAAELDVKIGEEVGFQVRFTGEVSRQTKVKVMTDGILLAEIQRDKLLHRYSTLIIDEAHERSLNIDFILGYLRQILPKRPDLKIIITSATIDPERFAQHFAIDNVPAPIEEVSGRTYPVEIRYRPLDGSDGEPAEQSEDDSEDKDPLDAVCDAVEELSGEAPGDVLIFFSGEREIRDAAEALRGRFAHHPRLREAEILPLFARLSLAEQHAVFSPGSRRRIVLATNVAETSLTVPGIKYVIDTGTARISRYSHRTKVQRLPIERISQASANQRAGRCGRVSDGICIRLYSEADFQGRREFTDPEILRTNLAAVILQMSAIGVAREPKDVASFPFVEPPDAKAIADGVALLSELGALQPDGGISPVGRQLAQLPVDPRLGRMIVESGKRGCAREVMILAAALTIQDPRERPTEKRQIADEKHKRFSDENSDFTGFLNLWRYLQEKQKELSSTAFRRLCKAEFINYLRVREWQDLFAQLRQLAKPLNITLSTGEVDPVGLHIPVHQSLLAGLLSHLGLFDDRKREYAGARGSRFAIFPGSALFKKNPDWVMSAELVETSRLWARVNARIDPIWAEEVAAGLVKRSYSEPHWSKRNGSVMAYEKVTLFGVPIVAQRRINYGRIDAPLSRELFIRHALVEGDWRTHHKFFHRNQSVLAEVEELETRMRRRDLRVDDETLFEFYDARVGAEVVSERHFDKWWKSARHENPTLLDFDPGVVMTEDADLDETAYPKSIRHGEFELALSYEFQPSSQYLAAGTPVNDSDGVTVTVPVLFLNQLEDAPFKWQIPGLRAELVTALIKSLPKPVRKNFVPAPDVGRQAATALAADLDPSQDDLESSLELALRRLRGHVIPPGSWNWDAVPVHLRMTFQVVDSAGKILDKGKDLAALQESLAGATRRAIAESLGAMPKTAAPKNPAQRGPSAAVAAEPSIRELSGLTSWSLGTIERSVSRLVNGHSVTGYPALTDEGTTAGLRVFQNEDEALVSHRAGVIRLLALRIPSPDRYVLEHLSNSEKLTFSQNPHGKVTDLIADCTLAAIDKLIPEELPFTEAEFDALYEASRAELIDTVFAVVAVVERILASARRIETQLKGSTSLALISALNDVRAQLDGLVYAGFISRTGYAQLSQLPRFLVAIEKRLEKLPTNVQRDGLNMAAVQRLEDEYDDAVAALAAGRSVPQSLRKVRWMLEELRVSLFAVELGTAYSVSEKRIRQAMSQALS